MQQQQQMNEQRIPSNASYSFKWLWTRPRRRNFLKMYHSHQDHLLPCLHCHPHSYIRMVHHLIERCLLLHMSRDQCIQALAEHASIRPLVTLAVWRELEKENWDFFQAYSRSVPFRPFPNRLTQRMPRLGRRKQWK